MDIETINNFLSTEEYKSESVIFKESSEFKKLNEFLRKIPINTKFYNNSNKYNASYAQLYKRKQGDNLESNVKKMNILLNKLSNRNLDDILQHCNDIILECEEIVPKMIESIFMKCSSQHTLCRIYTDLLIKLPQKDIKKTIQEKVDIYMNTVLETNNSKISTDESYDEFCDRLKEKSMFHGYSLFLTELHNKEYISLDYINKIMDIVVERLQGGDKINNETLILSLHAISMNIDIVDKLDAYIPLLQELVDNDRLEMKYQFQIQDILDRFDI